MTIAYLVNAAFAAVGLIFIMIAFGILTNSIIAGLSFPIALPSMMVEGDPWGIWLLSPIYLAPILLIARGS